MTLEELKQEIQQSAMVLAGIGENIGSDAEEFYEDLEKLLKKKDYFIVTLKERAALEKAGFSADRITAPLDEREPEESWGQYMNWLGFTLNQRLCILELGVGFSRPEMIRFPFEKAAYFNQKSSYIRIHKTFPQLSAEIAERGKAIKADPAVFLHGGEV